MHIRISIPKAEIDIIDSSGQEILHLRANDYSLNLDIARAITEAGTLAQLIGTIGKQATETTSIDVGAILDEFRQHHADKPEPAELGWEPHVVNWPYTIPPAYASGHARVEIRTRDGYVRANAPSKFNWRTNELAQSDTDIVAWRPVITSDDKHGTEPDEGWLNHYTSWPNKDAPVSYGLSPRDQIEFQMRSGAAGKDRAGDVDWSVDPGKPDAGDVIAWRVAK